MSLFPEWLRVVPYTALQNGIHPEQRNLSLSLSLSPPFIPASCKVISTAFPWWDSLAWLENIIKVTLLD